MSPLLCQVGFLLFNHYIYNGAYSYAWPGPCARHTQTYKNSQTWSRGPLHTTCPPSTNPNYAPRMRRALEVSASISPAQHRQDPARGVSRPPSSGHRTRTSKAQLPLPRQNRPIATLKSFWKWPKNSNMPVCWILCGNITFYSKMLSPLHLWSHFRVVWLIGHCLYKSQKKSNSDREMKRLNQNVKVYVSFL